MISINYVKCLVFSPDEKTFACILPRTILICNSETGHLISGPFQLKLLKYACFSPNGTHILVRDYDGAVIWDIKRGEEQFKIGGLGFVFIHHGHWHGSIASIN